MGSDVRLFLTPWLPAILLVSSLVATLFLSSELFGELLRFSYTIPFHVIAIIPYALTFVYVFTEGSWKKSVPAIVNFAASFLVWVGLIEIITANYSFW